MLLKKYKLLALLSFSLMSLTTLSVNAQSPQKHIIVAPECLIKGIDHHTLSSTKQFALIEVNKTGLDQLIAAKSKQKNRCGGFMNVTDAWKVYQNSPEKSIKNNLSTTQSFLTRYITPVSLKSIVHTPSEYTIQYTQEVNQLLNHLIPQNMWQNLTILSNFSNRHANSRAGIQAANWIKAQVTAMAKQNNRKDVKIFMINSGSSYRQPSVVVKIGASSDPAIVIGAHIDTLYAYFSSMPGADDDGTGSVTVLEIARALLSSDLRFRKPIYLIWYAAEEEGLVGSQHVVTHFKKQNILVDHVIHFDMTGYAYQNDMAMWLITDYTDQKLTDYLATLINTYVKKPVKYSSCGYACSDHAAWTMNGYKAAIAFEAEFGKDNPYIHTSEDIINLLSLEHMTDYLKLGTAFAVELAEPINAND